MTRTVRLEQVHIPEPCPADWSAMAGDDRTRFCESCGKHVHDLSARSRKDGEALLATHPTGLCVQMTLDRNGRVITQDGPRAWPFVRRLWPVMSMAVAFALGIVGCRRDPEISAGKMSMPGEAIYRTAGAIEPVTLRGDIALPPTTTQASINPPATQPTTAPTQQIMGNLLLPADPSN